MKRSAKFAMTRNRIQFQKGLCGGRFEQLYANEREVSLSGLRLALAVAAVGPGCGRRVLSFIRTLAPHQCSSGRRETLLTAGTIFFPTKLALRT